MQIKPLIAKAVAVFAMASGTSAETIVSHVHHTFFGGNLDRCLFAFHLRRINTVFSPRF